MEIIPLVLLLVVCFFLFKQSLSWGPQKIIPELKNKNVDMLYNGAKDDVVFKNEKFKIKAKPDFIFEHPDKTLTIVEFKSSRNGIRASHICQLIATAIAIKGTHGEWVRNGYVLTATNE